MSSRQRWFWKYRNSLWGAFSGLLLASWRALEQLALMCCDMDYQEASTSRGPKDMECVQPPLYRHVEDNNQVQKQRSGLRKGRWRVWSCLARTADDRECQAGEKYSGVDAAAAERKVCTFGNSEHYKKQSCPMWCRQMRVMVAKDIKRHGGESQQGRKMIAYEADCSPVAWTSYRPCSWPTEVLHSHAIPGACQYSQIAGDSGEKCLYRTVIVELLSSRIAPLRRYVCRLIPPQIGWIALKEHYPSELAFLSKMYFTLLSILVTVKRRL